MIEPDLDELMAPAEPTGVRLLPSGDPFRQQRDRERLLPASDQRRLLWRPIGGPGLVLVDGQAGGVWTSSRSGKTLNVTVKPFIRLSRSVEQAIADEAERIAPVPRGAASHTEHLRLTVLWAQPIGAPPCQTEPSVETARIVGSRDAAVTMSNSDTSVGRFYEPWQIYNERIVEVVRELSADELGVRPAPDGWPIWATVGHTAGARVYWLCGVFGEPGAETTPFSDPMSGIGWEDDLDTPRTAAELTEALETSWWIMAGCLQRWTPELLFEQFEAQADKKTQVHTRQSVLIRLLSHDAYHCGELSQTLGINGLPQIDLWRPE